MKKVVRITTRGRVTVPSEMRRKLGVLPGDYLSFEKDGDGFRITTVRKERQLRSFRASRAKKNSLVRTIHS